MLGHQIVQTGTIHQEAVDRHRLTEVTRHVLLARLITEVRHLLVVVVAHLHEVAAEEHTEDVNRRNILLMN